MSNRGVGSENTSEKKSKPRLPLIVPRNLKTIKQPIIKNATYKLTGTSGYNYEHWMSKQFKGTFDCFYPSNVGKTYMFDYYSKFFNFVELNSTFYGNPSEKTVKKWYSESPVDFRFLVKANKYITHSKKLLNFDETWPRFLKLISNLKEKCLGILLQLPPMFKNNARNFERLQGLLPILESTQKLYGYQVFIEFRDPSWFCPEVYELLRILKISLTIVNLNNTHHSFGDMKTGFSPNFEEVVEGSAITVPDTIMFRCHGTFSSSPYMGGYSDEELMMMASIASSKKKALVVFDNTDSYQYQIDIPWSSFTSGMSQTFKIGFDRKAILQNNVTALLPHAIDNALKIKRLLN